MLLKSTGNKFTWTNNQEESNRILAKLDYALTNSNWQEVFPRSYCDWCTQSMSDHSLGIIKFETTTTSKGKMFKFCNMWIQHPEYISRVKKAWSTSSKGSKMFIMWQKLTQVRMVLRGLHGGKFYNLSQRVTLL